jgi:hypothetical protein
MSIFMNAATLSSIAFEQRIIGDDCEGELTGTTEQSVIMQLLHDMVRSLEEKKSDANICTDSRLDPAACDDGFRPIPKMSDFIRSAHYSFLTYPAASSKKLRLSCSNEHAVETNCDVRIMSYDGLAATSVLNEESVEDVLVVDEGGMGSSIRQSQQPEPHQLYCQSLYGQTFDGPQQLMYIDINTDRDIVPSDHLPVVNEAINEGIAYYNDLPPYNEAMNEDIVPSDHLPRVDEAMNEGIAYYDDLPTSNEPINEGITHYDELPPYNKAMNEDIAPSDNLPLVDEAMNEDIVPSDHLPLVDEAMNEGITHYDDLPPYDEVMNEGFVLSDHLPLVDEAMNQSTAHYDDLPPYDEAMNEDIVPSDHLPLVDEAMNEGTAHYDDLPPYDELMNEDIVPSDHLPLVDEGKDESIAHYDGLPPYDEAMNEGFVLSDHVPLVDEAINEGIVPSDNRPLADEGIDESIAHYDGLPPISNEAMNEDIVPLDHLPLVDEGMSEGIAHIVGYSTSASASKDTRHEDFQSLWLQRKQLVEAAAEAKARHLFRQRQRDQVSLEASIDSSLREYGDMHEQAHALRLQFEDEKHRWMTAVLETARTAENTPGKRQRVPQSSPYSYYRDHTQQQLFSRAAAGTCGSSCAGDDQSILSTPGGCEDLHVQFQYEVDHYEEDRYEPQLPAHQQQEDHYPLRHPNGKRQKRFLVPIKVNVKVQE